MDILTYVLASRAGVTTDKNILKVFTDDTCNMSEEQKRAVRDNIDAAGLTWFDTDIMLMSEPDSEKLFTDLEAAKKIKSPTSTSMNALAWFANDCYALFNFDKNMQSGEVADAYTSRLIKNFNALISGGVIVNSLVVSGAYVFATKDSISNPNLWVGVAFMYAPARKELYIYNLLDDSRYIILNLANTSVIENRLNTYDSTLSIEGKAADAKAVGDALKNIGSDSSQNANGLTDTARTLLVAILRAAVYTSDQSANITALEAALDSGSSSGGGDSGGSGEDSGSNEGTETVTYTVTNTLSNVTTNNALVSVAENAAYTATLTAADGYELDSVTVTMGGVDITATAYSSGVVTIAAVTGDVVITATAKASSSGGGVVNLFDKDSMIVSGAYVGANGAIATSATSKYAKIPISTGAYALQKGSGWAMNTTGHPALIDTDGNVLCKFFNMSADGYGCSSSDTSVGTIAKANGNAGITVTVLSDAATHIIFSICVNGGTDDTDTTMMEVGDTCHDYVAYA